MKKSVWFVIAAVALIALCSAAFLLGKRSAASELSLSVSGATAECALRVCPAGKEDRVSAVLRPPTASAFSPGLKLSRASSISIIRGRI